MVCGMNHQKIHVSALFYLRLKRCWALVLTMAVCCPVSSYGQRGFSDRSADAMNESVYIVVGRIDGTRRIRRSLGALEHALRAQPGIEVTSHQEFVARAEQLGMSNALPEDGRSLQSRCDELEIDAAIYVTVDRHEAGRDIVVAVYAGVDGHFVSEHVVPAPTGRMTARLWNRVASIISPDLIGLAATPAPATRRETRTQSPSRRAASGSDADIPPYRASARRTRDVSRRIDELPIDDDITEDGNFPSDGTRHPLADIRIGGMAMSRSFAYTADEASQIFAEGGINYDLGFVPGLAVDARFTPFAQKRFGARGLGFRILFEKAFFRTQQTVTKDDGSESRALLDSNHSHIYGALEYTHFFASGGEVGGFLGYGFLTFELAENDEYSGSNYGYLSGGAKGYIPFGTPIFGLEVQASVIPFASYGETINEVGAEASVAGFSAYSGVAARFLNGLTLAVGGEYTAFNSDISGEGRGGRIGKSANDGFMVFRFLGGYRFR